MHTSTWLSGALSLLGAVAAQACNGCDYNALFPAAVCIPSTNGICQEQVQVIEVVVGKASNRVCDVCVERHHNDCAHCVTVVGPCPTPVNAAVTTTIINNGVTTVIIQTPTNAPMQSSAAASSSVSASVSASASASSASATPTGSAVPFSCNNNGYVMDGSDLYEVDLVSGQAVKSIAKNIAFDGAILAMGYNVLDNLIYALAPSSPSTVRVIQIDANGGQKFLGDTINTMYSVGDFDARGQLWVATADNTKWARIDLRPGSPNFGQVADSGTMTPLTEKTEDWAFLPSDGNFYSFVTSSTGNTLAVMWTRSNLQFQVLTDFGQIAMNGTQPPAWGPAFTDGTQIAVADTKSGQIWKFTPGGRAIDLKQMGTSAQAATQYSYHGGARCMDAANV